MAKKVVKKRVTKKSRAVAARDAEVKAVVRDLEAKPEHVQLVETLYTSLRKSVAGLIKDEGVSAANIIVIIDTAMKLAGKLRTLDGVEKKAVVITVVKKLIEESDLKPEDEAVVQILAERALDPAIDQLFAMAPELYGKVKAGCLGLCKR
ncbi:unnamed protein product, partial [marine sediment metagenome]